ncbi:hypothetical protein [Roseimarinus sediminis]|uniref:hypothetical protein n=1 Tax=Roseimarinus sediminis TaxID=1610899 RepID=UPI003D22FEDC
MLPKIVTFFAAVFLCSTHSLFAQNKAPDEHKAYFDALYGKDNQLYSGTLYYSQSGVRGGVAFYGEKSESYRADLLIKGRLYENQLIKYDLLLQLMVLQFTDQVGAQREIVLNPDVLDLISIPGHRFIPNPYKQIDSRFLEVIYEGDLACYISWTKEQAFRTTGDNAGYYYLKAKPAFYLLKNEMLHSFRNRRSFLRLFPEESRKEIRAYLAEKQFNFRSMNTYQLEMLIQYCEKTDQ